MSLATTMAALATTIETIAGYDETNVKGNDLRFLSGVPGKTKLVNIYHQAPSPRETLTLGNPVTIRNRWQLRAVIYMLTEGDPQGVSTKLEAEANLILTAINQYPNLHAGAGIIYAIVDIPDDIKMLEGSNWYFQTIHIEAQEIESITRLEALGV